MLIQKTALLNAEPAFHSPSFVTKTEHQLLAGPHERTLWDTIPVNEMASLGLSLLKSPSLKVLWNHDVLAPENQALSCSSTSEHLLPDQGSLARVHRVCARICTIQTHTHTKATQLFKYCILNHKHLRAATVRSTTCILYNWAPRNHRWSLDYCSCLASETQLSFWGWVLVSTAYSWGSLTERTAESSTPLQHDSTRGLL